MYISIIFISRDNNFLTKFVTGRDGPVKGAPFYSSISTCNKLCEGNTAGMTEQKLYKPYYRNMKEGKKE